MEVKECRQTQSKEKITEILDANNIQYSITLCHDCNSCCIVINDEQCICCTPAIIVQSYDKDTLYKIHPHEILYIAIENRKSVLYLIDRKIETNYPITHWTDILDKRVFVQPHYSFIVNLNYVYEITKDYVILNYYDKKYSVYASSRKIGTFKKAFTDFYNHLHNGNG